MWAKGAVSERKKKIDFDSGARTPFLWGQEGEGFVLCRLALLYGRWRGPVWQVTSLVLDQKIPGWLLKIMCLGEFELQLDQVFNLGLISWAFSRSGAVLGLCFLYFFL